MMHRYYRSEQSKGFVAAGVACYAFALVCTLLGFIPLILTFTGAITIPEDPSNPDSPKQRIQISLPSFILSFLSGIFAMILFLVLIVAGVGSIQGHNMSKKKKFVTVFVALAVFLTVVYCARDVLSAIIDIVTVPSNVGGVIIVFIMNICCAMVYCCPQILCGIHHRNALKQDIENGGILPQHQHQGGYDAPHQQQQGGYAPQQPYYTGEAPSQQGQYGAPPPQQYGAAPTEQLPQYNAGAPPHQESYPPMQPTNNYSKGPESYQRI